MWIITSPGVSTVLLELRIPTWAAVWLSPFLMAPASPITTTTTVLRQSVVVSPSDRFRGELGREPWVVVHQNLVAGSNVAVAGVDSPVPCGRLFSSAGCGCGYGYTSVRFQLAQSKTKPINGGEDHPFGGTIRSFFHR